jgi:hypothetical protein
MVAKQARTSKRKTEVSKELHLNTNPIKSFQPNLLRDLELDSHRAP